VKESQLIIEEKIDSDINLKEFILRVVNWMSFIKTQWAILLIICLITGMAGFFYAYFQKPQYTATLTFALEDEKSGSGGGLAGALGIASSLGIDLGTSAGGAFSGANLLELMKSRRIVEKALLNNVKIGETEMSLADNLIEFKKLRAEWAEKTELSKISFNHNQTLNTSTILRDSVMGLLFEIVTGKDGILNVAQKDKKISILSIEVKTENELFSKAFTESLAKEVSEFYVETKSKKAKMNVAILQKQTDSIRNELDLAIRGVAVANDNAYNLNPAFNVKRVGSTSRQVDVQANSAILTQLVANLEMAKVTLLKETPLIQVIDKPILPLKKDKLSKLRTMLTFSFLSGVVMVIFLTIKRKLATYK
jgi:uncharacterized protein involved in exopolysaccharide biosynthesis